MFNFLLRETLRLILTALLICKVFIPFLFALLVPLLIVFGAFLIILVFFGLRGTNLDD